MVRKPLAALAATALLLVVVPAQPAAASAASSARLTAGQSVFPGAGTFSVAVTNNEAPGFLGIGGTAINTVRINFPVNEAGITLAGAGAGAAPAGWSAEATDLGTTEYITYRGGSVAPGATTTFNFPASVLRPKGSDRSGDFRVQVSSNGGSSFTTAKAPEGSSLVSAVKVLEILPGSVKPAAPIVGDKGVGDRSGTAGQSITYGLEVVNHASGPISVTPSLTSDDTTDSPRPATAVTIGGNDAKAALTVPVVLGTAPAGGQAPRVFKVAAAGSSSLGSSTATPLDDSFTVQAPVTFSALELTPTRTKSDAPRTFSLRMTKAGVQGAEVATSTFTFGSNSRTLEDLAFGPNLDTQTVSYDFLKVLGEDGTLPASIVNTGQDDNLAALDPIAFTAGAITLDNIAPVLQIDALLPTDAQGDQQVASANDDVITVSGNVSGTDLDAETLKVKLLTDKGRELPVTVRTTPTGDGLDFEGTVNVGTWAGDESRFFPTAAIDDTATNEGTQTGLSFPIDVELPVLRNPAVILTPTTIEVKFLDDNFVRGGCDPASWSIGGRPGAVVEVRGNGGAACDPRALSDGVRTLVLSERNALRTTDTPSVTYDATRLLGRLAAKDGAGNDAVTATVETITNLVPLAPVLTTIERRDGGTTSGAFETAYRDPANDTWYTNAPDGPPAQSGEVNPSGNRVTVSGVRNGYVLQVRATPNGPVLAQSPTFNNTSPLAPSEYSGSVGLPVGAVDGKVTRYLTFLVAATGRVSPATEVLLELDRKVPTIATETKTSDTTVRARFAEPIVAGTDAADDWFVTEAVALEDGTEAGRTVNVNEVTSVDEFTRDLTFELLNPSRYRDTDYFFQNPGGRQYEDRAGNLLASTLRPAA